jgi:hypothetical protein
MPRPWRPVRKKAGRRFAGHPIATVAFYGPDDKMATKVAVGIILKEGGDAEHLRRWLTPDHDVRQDESVGEEVIAFIREHEARTVVMADRIIGCPHEEGVDYPEGESCPQCPFWANRDRWTGELLQ